MPPPFFHDPAPAVCSAACFFCVSAVPDAFSGMKCPFLPRFPRRPAVFGTAFAVAFPAVSETRPVPTRNE